MANIKKLFNRVKTKKQLKISDLSAIELSHYSNPILTWTAASFIKFKRTKNWYLTLFSLMALLVLIAVLLKSPTFAIAIIVFAMVYIHLTQDDPDPIQVLISDAGILFGNKVYPYTEIKTFWIEYQPPAFQSLHLVLKDEFSEEVTINFHGVNPTEIRSVLVNYLPEWEERQKTWIENLTRILGL